MKENYEQLYKEAFAKAREGKNVNEIFPNLFTKEERAQRFISGLIASSDDPMKEDALSWMESHKETYRPTAEQLAAMKNVCEWKQLPTESEITELRTLYSKLNEL